MNALQQQAIDVLNGLLAAESRGLLPRLAETHPFVSWASAEKATVLQGMIADQRQHAEWLVEALDQCGGAVQPTGADVHSGHLHYLDVHTLLPLIIESIESLVRVYGEASSQPLPPAAAEVVGRILACYETHLDQLRHFGAKSPAPAQPR